jgi:hypothetical protein
MGSYTVVLVTTRGGRSHQILVNFPSPRLFSVLRLDQSDPTICGKYEKLLSDNYDIVPVRCFVGEYTLSIQVACNVFDSLDHVEVKHFDETSIYQFSIGDEEWFTRYEFLYDARRITVSFYSSILALTL